MNDPAIPISGSIRRSIEERLTAMASYPGIRSIIELPKQALTEIIIKTGATPPAAAPIADTCLDIGLSGWAAWTVADDVRDETDAPVADMLGTFSLLSCSMHRSIQRLSLGSNERNELSAIIRRMEEANQRESAEGKRIETDRHDLRYISVWKSMGAALPMAAFMMKIGAPRKDLDSLKRYFYHLISARQISDDVCDLEEDSRGERRTRATMRRETGATDAEIRAWAAREIDAESERSIVCAREISCFENVEFLTALPRRYMEMAEAELARTGRRPRAIRRS